MTTPAERLAAALTEPDPAFEDEAEILALVPTLPESVERADRWGRRLFAYRRELAEIEAAAQAEKDRIQVWLASERDRLGGRIAFAERTLELFSRSLHERTRGARRAVTLPCGLRLRLGRQRSRVEVGESDEAQAAVVAWLTENAPELLNPEKARTPNKNALAKLPRVDAGEDVSGKVSGLLLDGETIPGVSYVEPKGLGFTLIEPGVEEVPDE